jgi:hypothetical protein
MKTINRGKPLALALVLVSILAAGCIFGPEEEKVERDKPQWKPLTDTENVLYNLALAHNTADIDCFLALLHPDYAFYLDARDVEKLGKGCYTRGEDSAMTARMFLAAKGQHPDPLKNITRLELKISDGTWTPVAELNGNPCDDCWETMREYHLMLEMQGGAMTLYADQTMMFTVVPVVQGDTKIYQLLRCDDIRKN